METAYNSQKTLPLRCRSHQYDVRQSLGTYRYLQPKRLMEDIKAAKIFPLIVLDGQMKAIGDKITLSFPGLHFFTILPFAKNEVIVTEITETNVRIRACSSHVFKGTVSHGIELEGNELFYVLNGSGPFDGEEFLRYHANLFFAKYLWPILIKYRVVPYAKELEKSLEKSLGT